ncbi:MAG: glycerophosphoryl diester phosphodiesterase [Actinomycetota bacterium]|nr:glycerophosphoryl diester phosphodiesterase [Actinomycetota bacterium]MDQ1502654.1 glycerophosphoryl diester phosphodiesterase [Actinomycetota bacterium]
MSTRFPFLDWPYPIPFAHRGGAAEVGGENTLGAFGRAVAMGYRYLETDGRVTSDGVLLAFHDERLDRVTDLEGRLEDRPWSEVRHAKVGPAAEPITTMEALLDAFPDTRFNIDPKMDAAVAPLAEALRRTNAWDRVNIAAFSDRRLLQVRRALLRPVCTSMGPAAIARLRLAAYGVPVGPFAGACVQVPLTWKDRTLVDARFVNAAARRGIPVHVWTIDEPDEINRLLDLGVRGIMTDRPSVLKDVMERRGQWLN